MEFAELSPLFAIIHSNCYFMFNLQENNRTNRQTKTPCDLPVCYVRGAKYDLVLLTPKGTGKVRLCFLCDILPASDLT